jgi:hypothetical protein
MTLFGNRENSSVYSALFMDISVYPCRNGLNIVRVFPQSVFFCFRQRVRQCVAAEYFMVLCNGRQNQPAAEIGVFAKNRVNMRRIRGFHHE